MNKTWSKGVSTGRRFLPELRPHRRGLLGVGGLSLAVIALELLRPWPIKWVIDGALAPEGEPVYSFTAVIWISAAALVAIAGARAAANYAREIRLAGIGHLFTRGLRFKLFEHLTRLSPSYHARHKSGDLLVRLMGDVPMVTTMMVDAGVELATRGVLVLGTLAVMAALDPALTAGVVLTLPVLYLVVRWISNHIRIAVRKQRRKEGDLADYLHEAIAAAPTIQSLGGSDHVVRRFARNNRRTARAGLKATRLAARLSGSVEALVAVTLGGVLVAGSYHVREGVLLPGDLLVFLSYVRNLIKPLRAASKHAARIAKGSACGERILSILDARELVSPNPGAPRAPARPARLVFEDVTYGYGGGGPPALRRFSATFARGELAALVGRSGAGKSTAAALAQRLFDPQSGRILLDDRPLDGLELSSVREAVGVVLQKPALFGDTLRENLSIARPEAGDDELEAALRAAGCGPYLEKLPDGLETALGAGGVGLSGGEAKRFAIAQAFLRGTPVLIVDEPFAGLDREAMDHVAASLRALARERILIVIAHDFDGLEHYDRIVFLDEGERVGEGTHVELARRNELYRRVVRGAAVGVGP